MQTKLSEQYLIGTDEAGRSRSGLVSHRPEYLIGIDEAGRGPLAGPVVVAGVKLHIAGNGAKTLFRGIRDSKKLSAQKREKWFRFLTAHPHIQYAVARVWPKMIDRINIHRATNLGARRVYRKLAPGKICPALLDGSLYLSAKVPFRTIIKGDEKVPLISAASIIAKVTRDRLMVRLHRKYPQYRFDIHKGYGTKMHRELLAVHGLSKVHRRSFRVAKS